MKPRILIVEDEAIIAAGLKMDLIDFGYDVLPVAATADRAVALAEEHEPDLILMDVVLRGRKTGIDAAIEIRKAREISIFFLTGNVHLFEDTEWTRIPACMVIPKPVISTELHSFIEEVLGRRNQ